MSENSKGLTYEEAHAAKPVGYIFKAKTITNGLEPTMQDHITLGEKQNLDDVNVYREDVVLTLKGQVADLWGQLEAHKTAFENMRARYEAERQRQFTEAGWFFPKAWITDNDASTLNETIEATKRAPTVMVTLEGYGVQKEGNQKKSYPAAWIKNGYEVQPTAVPPTATEKEFRKQLCAALSLNVDEVRYDQIVYAVMQKVAESTPILGEDRVSTLFDAIKHGDEAHQSWLKEAIEAHFAGQPVPPVVMNATGEQSWVVKLGSAVARFHEPIVINGLKIEKLEEIYKRLMTYVGMPNSHSLLGVLQQLVNEITHGSASLVDIVHLVTGDKTEDQVFWGNTKQEPANSPVGDLQNFTSRMLDLQSISAKELGIDTKRLGKQAGFVHYRAGRLRFYDMGDTYTADLEVYPVYFEGGNYPPELSPMYATPEMLGLGKDDCQLPPAQIQTGAQLNAYIEYMRTLEDAISTYVSSSMFAQANESSLKEVRASMMKHYLDLWLKENIPAEQSENECMHPGNAAKCCARNRTLQEQQSCILRAAPVVDHVGVQDNSAMLPKPVYSKEALNDPTNVQKAVVMATVGNEKQQQEAREFLTQHLGQ